MNEKKFDNSNQVAAWINDDGSISISGNLFGNDFRIRLFKNDKKTEGSKQPDYRGKLKTESPITKPVITDSRNDEEDVPF